jgi:Cu(I)/Ag(I) efflux system membrane fusion protein
MTDQNTTHDTGRPIPRGKAGIISLAVVAVVAFSLGLLLSGGDNHQNGEEAAGNSTEASVPEVWTCSMHPQIQLPKQGKCPICGMDLIPLETGSGDDLGPRQLRMSESARQLARIQTSTVKRAFAEAEIRMVGRVAYDETRVSYITAWVPGRLDRLYADYTGVMVSPGDHMVHMYSPQLLASQEELVQARRAIDALSDSQSRVLLSTARATVEASREKLRLLGLTPEQISEVERTGETSDHLTIYAPIGGVVVSKDALEGMYVQTGSRIYTIADLSRLWILLDAYESDLPWLRYGQRVEFTSPSFPGETFDAVISFIDPIVDPKTRTVKVRAVVDNSAGRLKPDMFTSGVVRSRIDQEGHVLDLQLAGKWIGPMHPEIVKDGPGDCDICGMPLVPAEEYGYAERVSDDPAAPLLVPATAALLTGTRAVVYVELQNRDEPTYEGREVTLGPRAGDFYVVRSGLSEGESVVTNGAFKIDAELQIQAKPSMMSPEGGGAPAHHHGGDMPTPADAAHSEPAAIPVDSPLKINADAQMAFAPVYYAYLASQNAQAKDDHGSARAAFADLATANTSVDMSLFEGDAHIRWMALSARLDIAADAGAKASDITSARSVFGDLSRAIVDLHGSFGHGEDRELFLAHCPMALNGEGAYWLQTEDVVNNPHYGSQMLRCGSIKEVYDSGLPAEVAR